MMSSYLYYQRLRLAQLCQEATIIRSASPGDAQSPGEDVQLSLQQPHLVSQLGSGGRDQGRVNPRVETSARVDTQGVALLGGGASQHRDQAVQGWSQQCNLTLSMD